MDGEAGVLHSPEEVPFHHLQAVSFWLLERRLTFGTKKRAAEATRFFQFSVVAVQPFSRTASGLDL
jgi:hypothetical protein